ncbi:hypothetical protein QEZ54_20855 [Catellatospora sp. KI3]|uniref:hypothetical protein n=1 Tax=Catellatospora sp. KI3 TaxID=3041620 RepID=UPI0024830448|nr:hypothetical protein [Catellatospora sp. KI3]MDI1463435.1 hypothetical protein [Catellatospora sp. KI3]
MPFTDWLVPLITGLLGAGAALLGQVLSSRNAASQEERVAARQEASEIRRRSEQESDRLRSERIECYMRFLSVLDEVVAEAYKERNPQDFRAWADQAESRFMPLLTSIEVYGSNRMRKIASGIGFDLAMSEGRTVQSLAEFQDEVIRAVRIDLGTIEWSVEPGTKRGHRVGFPCGLHGEDDQIKSFYESFVKVERMRRFSEVGELADKTQEAKCASCKRCILVYKSLLPVQLKDFCHRCYLLFHYGESALDWYR